MKIIPFQELYNSEFFISDTLAKGQNWFSRNNFYSCIGKPKPSHTLLWFKNCRAVITDKGGRELTVEKNQIAYMAKGIEYTVRFFDTAPYQDDTVVFHFQLTDAKEQEIAPTLSPVVCIKSVDLPKAMENDSAAKEFYRNIVCVPAIKSIIYQLLAYACQRQRNKTVRHKFEYIREGIELLENNSDKTLTEIAQVCGVSEGHFRKLFREYSGENPIEFRQRHRIEKAKQLLLLDTLSISEIAEELHFSDIYHFSKAFKKFCNCSPSQFLKSTTDKEM